MILGDILTKRHVLRAAGVIALLPGVPMIVVPGLIVTKFFDKQPASDATKSATATDTGSVRTDYLARSAGIMGVSSAVLNILEPTRELLHVRIVESLAGIVLDTHHCVEHTKENTRERLIAQVTTGLKTVVFIALVIAKRNDDEAGGHEWHKIRSTLNV